MAALPDSSAELDNAESSASYSPKGATVSVRVRSGRFGVTALAFLRFLGIDEAIAYTIAGRGWSVIATPITWFLFSRYLSPAEQGFYYTFGSIIALNVFFELGLNYVLIQFSSHEKAHLEWTAPQTLSGSELAHGRLSRLLKMALKWYSIAAALIILVLMPAGMIFFSRNDASTPGIEWRAPWIFLTFASALTLLSSPLLAILEGCGKVAHIASLRFGQSILANGGLWLTLKVHGALYASPIFEISNVIFAVGWIAFNYRNFFRTLLLCNSTNVSFDWKKEVWPFQWRIALSWLSVYFVGQLFNPILFATRGPVIAGQMGISLNICGTLLTVSLAWMTTKISPLGTLVANREWASMDSIFFRTVRQAFFVLLTSCALCFAVVFKLFLASNPFSKRLVDPDSFAFILLAALVNYFIFCEGIYLRAHKKEPFMLMSVAIGILTIGSTLAFAKPFGTLGVSIGYFTCSFLGLAIGTRIFVKKRTEWHSESVEGQNF